MKSAETALSFLFKLTGKSNIKGQALRDDNGLAEGTNVFMLPPAGYHPEHKHSHQSESLDYLKQGCIRCLLIVCVLATVDAGQNIKVCALFGIFSLL